MRLSERVRLVRAANPSPMTLEGTNTYIVGAGDDVLIVDPGPADASHLKDVRAALEHARVTAILLTHRHPDHAEGARMFADAFDAQVLGFEGPDGVVDVPVADATRAGGNGVFLTALHTPGHAHDHLCYMLEEERALFSGDHVLGRGTSVIVWPDGDMAAYVRGVRRLIALDPKRIFPGHGPVIEEPAPVLAYYLSHRLERERQILQALVAGPGAPAELVKRVYTDVDASLHAMAELSLRAHLAKLKAEGRVTSDGEVWRAS